MLGVNEWMQAKGSCAVLPLTRHQLSSILFESTDKWPTAQASGDGRCRSLVTLEKGYKNVGLRVFHRCLLNRNNHMRWLQKGWGPCYNTACTKATQKLQGSLKLYWTFWNKFSFSAVKHFYNRHKIPKVALCLTIWKKGEKSSSMHCGLVVTQRKSAKKKHFQVPCMSPLSRGSGKISETATINPRFHLQWDVQQEISCRSVEKSLWSLTEFIPKSNFAC